MLQNDRRNRLFRLFEDMEKTRTKRTMEFERLARPVEPSLTMSRTSGGIYVVGFGDPKVAEQNRKMMEKARIYERIGEATGKVVSRASSSPLCIQIGDADFHRMDARSVMGSIKNILGEFENGMSAINPRNFDEYVRSEISLASLGISAIVEVRHALFLSKALGISPGGEIRHALGEGLFDALEHALQLEQCQRIAEKLGTKGEEKLASMLLAELYGAADAKRRLRLVLQNAEPEALSIPEPVKAECRAPKHVDGLAERVRGLVDASDDELNEYRNEFGGDAGKIAKAISISRAGASKKLAFFAVENSMDEETLSFMIDAEEMICPFNVECEDVFHALEELSPENRAAILASRELMERAAGWLLLMPNYMRERPELAFLLGLNFEAPDDKAFAHPFLAAHKAELEDALLRNDGEALGRMESDLDAFEGYVRRFVKAEKKGEAPAAEDAPAPVRQMRPHESLLFSADSEAAMAAEGVQPEDLRRILAYGLRLSSSKGARGGKYFQTQLFRQNSERVLSKEGGERPKRREAVEEFLARHGTISYKKDGGHVVRLNTKDDVGVVVDETGKRLLGEIIRWMQEFQKETAR